MQKQIKTKQKTLFKTKHFYLKQKQLKGRRGGVNNRNKNKIEIKAKRREWTTTNKLGKTTTRLKQKQKKRMNKNHRTAATKQTTDEQ